MSSPWADIQKPLPVNLQDIISEAKREKKCAKDIIMGHECQSGDEHLARMLQEEYDREQEASQDTDYDSEEDMDALERKEWEEFDALDREEALMPTCNSFHHDGKVNKYKEIMDEIRNAGKIVLFVPKYQNSMGYHNFKFYKIFSGSVPYVSDGRQKINIEDKPNDHEFGLSNYTCNLLYRLIYNKTLRKVNGVIGAGKESIVLHAVAEQNYPEKYAIKVFRNDIKRFNNRIEQLTACRMALQEMKNLVKLREAGILCPRVVTLKKHFVVMSFIGDDLLPAPSLKELSANFDIAYDQVINMLKTMYRKANLVHDDLTVENILWYKNQCYLIDVSQAVDLNHEDALHLLFWGCCNITSFFVDRVETMSIEELFEFITGTTYEQKMPRLDLQQKEFPLKPKKDRRQKLKGRSVKSKQAIKDMVSSLS